MNVSVSFKPTELRQAFRAPLSPQQQRRILGVMGATFKRIVISNFGATGADRPTPWPPLSKPYAKRVKRPYATLELRGRLFRSVKLTVTDESATVFTDSPYAEAHQWGIGKMPVRPFFPMNRTRFTQFAERACVRAGQMELDKIVSGTAPSAIY